jgi:hypothetical protein
VFDGERFGQQMAEMVRDYVAGELGPIRAENAALRAELDELKQRAPEKGDPGEPGPAGKDGANGQDGKDGVGLADALTDEEGQLVLTMSDGRTKQLGVIRGADGVDGKDGERGPAGFSLEHFAIETIGERTVKYSFRDANEEVSACLTPPSIIYRGVWEEKAEYEPGDVTTWAGAAWHCDEAKGLKPGDADSGWRMMVKRGRDGKDAPK